MEMWLCVLGTLAMSVCVRSLDCTRYMGSERAYPPNNCLTFSGDRLISHSSANAGCELVTFVDSEQFDTLARYLEVLPQSQTLHWTGYRYNASDILVGPDNSGVPPESPVLNFGNYASLLSQLPGVDGVCLAVGLDSTNEVKLFRMNCALQLGYICSESVNAPNISLSTSVSRFLAQGSPITITCSTTDTINSVQWRRDNTVVTADTPGVTIASGGDTLSVNSFDGVRAVYECVVGNKAGGVVSEAVVLDSSGGTESTAPDITGLSASSSSVQFGTSVNLTCSFTATSALYSVEWFVNGYLRQTTTLSGNETQDVFVVDRFSEDGVYQCRVFSGNRDNSIEGVFISGRAGTPGLVRFPISLADTQTQVFISWFPPVDLNVIDPLLLRYELYYRQGTSFDESTAQKVTDIPPLLLSGGVSPEGVVETTLSSLQPGTTYTLTVQAVSSAGSGELLGDRVIVTTFGNVPTVTVDDSLKARRTKDNKTLFADWDDIKTIPPVGGVARYWVDYRDSNKEGSINSVILEPKYSYLVVSPVEDAQNYQVRVRVGVITRREPLTYSYGPFSKWMEVQGIVNEVLPAPPTVSLRPAGVIAAAVIVPVCVVALIVLILVVVIVCCCIKGPGRSASYRPKKRERLDSQAIGLQPQDSTAQLKLPERESSPVSN